MVKMKIYQLLVLIGVCLLENVHSATPDSNLLKYYEKSAKDLFSEHLSGTQFCESILLPTHHALRKSLLATLFTARNSTHLDNKDRSDLCCRALHKCDAFKRIELNSTSDGYIPICECVHSFRLCLKNLNNSISSDLAFIHSLNATKCYAKDYPIIKCVEFETFLESRSEYRGIMSSNESEIFFNRCQKYKLDESQPQKLQLFDLPFFYRPTTAQKPILGEEKPLNIAVRTEEYEKTDENDSSTNDNIEAPVEIESTISHKPTIDTNSSGDTTTEENGSKDEQRKTIIDENYGTISNVYKINLKCETEEQNNIRKTIETIITTTKTTIIDKNYGTVSNVYNTNLKYESKEQKNSSGDTTTEENGSKDEQRKTIIDKNYGKISNVYNINLKCEPKEQNNIRKTIETIITRTIINRNYGTVRNVYDINLK